MKWRPVIIVAEGGGSIPVSRLRKLVHNPKRITDEDEADYQYSMAVIRQGGKDISLAALRKKYGYR